MKTDGYSAIARIYSAQHEPQLTRCKIQWLVDFSGKKLGYYNLKFILTDANDETLYGYDEFTIEQVRVDSPNSITCYVDPYLVREDELDVTDGTNTVKVYLNRGGVEIITERCKQMNIPCYSPNELTRSNATFSRKRQQTLVDTSDNTENDKDSSDDTDLVDKDGDKDTDEITSSETSSTETSTSETSSSETSTTEEAPKRVKRGWFSWLW